LDKDAIKVLLVDDHPLVLESLSTLLEPHFAIVGRVQDARDIIRRADECRPDVILMDACMPGTSGFEATQTIKKHLPKVKVIVVTMLTEATSISEAFRSGANGYVLKQSVSEELHEAIHAVLASKRFLSQKIALEVRESLEHEWVRSADYSGKLTEREREVLVLLSQGGSAKQIAKQLDISIKTVEFHRANLTRKLGVHTISELTKFALAHGLTTL
jgi:DNA-binding NarL/FixJ family response regulator